MAYYGIVPIRVGAASESTWPSQPAFFAYLATTQTNKTGAGTAYQIGANALTEIYDAGSDFNTNGTFTAPVTGKYLFVPAIQAENITALGTLAEVSVITSNRNFFLGTINAGAAKSANNSYSWHTPFVADMDAMDTCVVRLTISNQVGNTASIVGSADMVTYLAGWLIS